MKTLSLARIMYGTSEEFHVSDSANSSAASSFPAPSSTSHADGNAAEPESLGELLHRAWTNLSGRN
jgi:hypothetical protein